MTEPTETKNVKKVLLYTSCTTPGASENVITHDISMYDPLIFIAIIVTFFTAGYLKAKRDFFHH